MEFPKPAIPAGLLSKFLSLTRLSCNSAGLTSFGVQDLPPSHPKLTSLRLFDNKIEQFNEELFKALPSLKVLDLSLNRLEQVPSLIHVPKLEELDLAFNKISHISDDAFNGLENLKRINLGQNLVTSAALRFDQKVALDYLSLASNNIEVLRVGDFQQLNQLKELNIAGTRLRHIELGAFSTLTELEQLILTNNNLKELDFGGFLPSMPSLKILKLARNSLVELDDNFDQLFPQLKEFLKTQEIL